MIFGESPIGLDTIAGGSVTGMLAFVMVAFLRRTKDTDERRDEASRMLADAAMGREARAWSERDKALSTLDDLRREMARLQAQMERERQQWMEERWTILTGRNPPPPPESSGTMNSG